MARSDNRTLVGLFDVLPRVVDQMHVVHTGGTGGHAGEARQATIDMLDHLSRGRLVLFQHLLDQVDAPARRIELVAEQYVGRTGRGAESAMHAGAQDFFRGGDLRIFQLRESERGLHYRLIFSVVPAERSEGRDPYSAAYRGTAEYGSPPSRGRRRQVVRR